MAPISNICALFVVHGITTYAKEDFVEVYSSCDPTPNSEIHKNNGLYYIKPFADGPIIPAICSNGYTMIDASLDLNMQSLPSYLSSWDYTRISVDYIITNLDDTSTFRQWWLPSTNSTKYRVAKECKSCESATKQDGLSDNVVYYTDAYQFCYTYFEGNACAQNINEYACNKCDYGIFSTDSFSTYWNKCSALQVSPDTPSLHEPQMRVNHHLIYRPVMATTRSACTCYQISSTQKPTKYVVSSSDLPYVTLAKQTGSNDVRYATDYIDSSIIFDDGHIESRVNDEPVIDCENNIHYLSQNDFLYGTYRITECGEYIFTEDIFCNFNAPSKEEEESSNFSPNSITNDRLYWYPTREQTEQYPGLYTYEGSYSLGFFAGITVECEDVIINLNGFEFAMDRRFYLQQRFFSLIELAAKPFLPIQGASNWGLTDVFYAKNVEIKGPGTIGLSSHHGIHGNDVNMAYIHDLNIASFDVAGLACNGCEDLRIENLLIGPQNQNIPTLGRYTHSRAFIPRLMDLNNQFGDEEIQFYNRSKTNISALCQRMVDQMDMIYHNYINHKEYDPNDAEWIAAQKLFKNPTGWMDGGSSYGMVLHGGGAAVVGIGTRTAGSSKVSVHNVEIFGIYNQAQEKIKFSNPDEGTSRGILFDVMDWIAVSDQIADRSQSQYIGDVFTDIRYAANKFMTSWYYRNSQYIADEEVTYVFDGNTKENGYPFLTIFPQEGHEDKMGTIARDVSGCGTDIQLHSSKGAIGMMVDGPQEVEINDVFIHDVYNWADLGMDVCGEYEGPHLTTEDIDISYGYTATRAHGMVMSYTSGNYVDIRVENVESWNGEANGMTIYKESYVNLQNIVVKNVNAGTMLNESVVDTFTLPNLVPRACAVDIHENTMIDFIEGEDVENIMFENVNGFEICNQFEDTERELSIMNDDDDDDKAASFQINPMVVVWLLFGVSILMTSIYASVLYHSGCVWDEDRNGKLNCEQTPLLRHV